MKKGEIIFFILLFFVMDVNSGATYLSEELSLKEEQQLIHPVHLSFTTVEYFEEEKKFKILFKLFVDDLDLVLKEKYGKDLKLLEGRWEKNYDKIINAYILEHFRITMDGKDKTKSVLKLTSHEVKEQAMWLYYDFNYKAKSEIFNIQNTLMMDLYPDQKNLLIFVFKEEQKAVQFNVKQTKQEIRF